MACAVVISIFVYFSLKNISSAYYLILYKIKTLRHIITYKFKKNVHLDAVNIAISEISDQTASLGYV